MNSLNSEPDSPAVIAQPRGWLRLESAAALGVAVTLYAIAGYSWILFAAIFFVPDISFAGYLASSKIGAWCYNIAHTNAIPLALAITLHFLGESTAIPLIWIAHIGFDRVLGYGLKYPTGFGYTHLGRLGKK
jgi:Domain of unknown function (DUF4260)